MHCDALLAVTSMLLAAAFCIVVCRALWFLAGAKPATAALADSWYVYILISGSVAALLCQQALRSWLVADICSGQMVLWPDLAMASLAHGAWCLRFTSGGCRPKTVSCNTTNVRLCLLPQQCRRVKFMMHAVPVGDVAQRTHCCCAAAAACCSQGGSCPADGLHVHSVLCSTVLM